MKPHAHEIIRTWTFYTIVKSFYHENKIPWENLMISGFVTMHGEKMSKSIGNIVDPKDVIEKYGSDCLRFWAAGLKLGEDHDYQEKDLITAKRFETKLWNASKFVFMNLKEFNPDSINTKKLRFNKIDDLFLLKLNNLIDQCRENFESYEYYKAKIEIEKFFWKLFCDNYLEIVKKRIYQKENESAKYCLYYGLLSILKLIAPIMPFITEEIYQSYFIENPDDYATSKSEFSNVRNSPLRESNLTASQSPKQNKKEKSIHTSEWPKQFKTGSQKKDEKDFDLFIDILSKVRQEKTRLQKSMKSEIRLSLKKEDIKKLGEMIEDLKDVTNSVEIKDGNFKVEFI
jgi:valyl-tRNA synthetase